MFSMPDRKVVTCTCYKINAFPEHMDSPVARLHPEGVLRKQNVPSMLPAYNKYMCAVDRTNQLGKTIYDLDRKSRRFWLRLMNRLFKHNIILYRHNYIVVNAIELHQKMLDWS